MSISTLRDILGLEIEDPEEGVRNLEQFLLFSQSLPSQNLGFVDSRATELTLNVGNRELSIHQSPTLLSSNRSGGTTGAVVWKITPLFANWISSSNNFLFQHALLDSSSFIIELGSGISGIIGLSLGPSAASYILTDQEYVMKLLNRNLDENRPSTSLAGTKGRKSAAKSSRGSAAIPAPAFLSNIAARTLDWETDQVTAALTGSDERRSFDAVIACDCIYNDALVQPLVQTCVDVCKLRVEHSSMPTVCIIAQQLRSPEVFEAWLQTFHKEFHVWRVPDEKLTNGLRTDSGFVLHIGILR